jgi:hypothetical protein
MGSTPLVLLFSFERSRAWAYSSAWLERTPDKREVGGSSPPRPTRHALTRIESGWGCSSAGRAPALHAGGHRFDPVHLHHNEKSKVGC